MEFEADSIEYIKRFGFLFTGKLSETVPKQFKGKVQINGVGRGEVFDVIGMESPDVNYEPEGFVPEGTPVGLLVMHAGDSVSTVLMPVTVSVPLVLDGEQLGNAEGESE